ncbi:MAG TPA: serine/threonine-protein kinase, partial [Ignavibacteria bacterium]|nr:serine/threonine-protein kinase [Ignavibacteria bacterium]
MINERYFIHQKLGEGRSAVFLCTDQEFPGEKPAMKILPYDVDEEEKKYFISEYFTLKKLNHPNIITTNDLGSVVKNTTDINDISLGSKFFTLEYFDGKPLLAYDNLEDENIVREILRQICSTLYYLHQSNYIYYDLKPENILVKNVDGKPVIKLIDLGFSQHIINNNKDVIRGSAEYMAPEILKKEIHDYRVDLYSLGIILYRLVYKTFPFETTDELEIYKAHLEKDFEFPNSHYSKKFINIVKKLLNKNPNERYSNTLQVLNDLDIKIDESLAKDWMPAKVFSNRKDILTILQKYISDRSSGEVFTIKGFEGSGKTALVEEIYSSYDKVVYINSSNTKTGRNFVNFIIKQILYNTFIYPKLDGNTIDKIEKFFEMKTLEFIDDLKSILTSILNKNDFIIILDGFNIYDQFTHETLKNLIPIFQVNKIKVILTETSDLNYKSDFIHNLRELNLTSFTDV